SRRDPDLVPGHSAQVGSHLRHPFCHDRTSEIGTRSRRHTRRLPGEGAVGIGRRTPMARIKKPAAKERRPADEGVRLYTLEVFLLSGPITAQFARKNPVVSRIIQVRGDQTLQDLHHAIFDAFGRWEEHMYEFQFGKGPMDPKGPRYVLPGA